MDSVRTDRGQPQQKGLLHRGQTGTGYPMATPLTGWVIVDTPPAIFWSDSDSTQYRSRTVSVQDLLLRSTVPGTDLVLCWGRSSFGVVPGRSGSL